MTLYHGKVPSDQLPAAKTHTDLVKLGSHRNRCQVLNAHRKETVSELLHKAMYTVVFKTNDTKNKATRKSQTLIK